MYTSSKLGKALPFQGSSLMNMLKRKSYLFITISNKLLFCYSNKLFSNPAYGKYV